MTNLTQETKAIETPKVETTKVETTKAPKVETTKVETTKVETTKATKATKKPAAKKVAPKVETTKSTKATKKPVAKKVETPKVETPKVETPKVEKIIPNPNNKLMSKESVATLACNIETLNASRRYRSQKDLVHTCPSCSKEKDLNHFADINELRKDPEQIILYENCAACNRKNAKVGEKVNMQKFIVEAISNNIDLYENNKAKEASK